MHAARTRHASEYRAVCVRVRGVWVCPVSGAIFNSSTVQSHLSVGGFGQNRRTHNNIQLCAPQNHPEEGKLAELMRMIVSGLFSTNRDLACSKRTGISRVTLLPLPGSSRGFSGLQGQSFRWAEF